MTLLEAFGAIFTGIWVVLSSPTLCMVYGVIIIFIGLVMFILACVVPHETRTDFWQRMSYFVGGPLVMITGLAISLWAGTSSIDPTTWR